MLMHTWVLKFKFIIVYRDPNTGRGSVASRGSKHDSKHDISQLGNVRSSEDIRRVSIELPQPLTTNAASVDWVRVLYVCVLRAFITVSCQASVIVLY